MHCNSIPKVYHRKRHKSIVVRHKAIEEKNGIEGGKILEFRTLLVLAAIVCGISGLVWVPAQAQTSGVFEAMLVKQEARPSPTLIPELTPTTTQLTEDNQAVQTSTP